MEECVRAREWVANVSDPVTGMRCEFHAQIQRLGCFLEEITKILCVASQKTTARATSRGCMVVERWLKEWLVWWWLMGRANTVRTGKSLCTDVIAISGIKV